jgi:hypothetical protein
MSLWLCPTHGLYGGQVFCPKCGGGGEYVTLTLASGIAAATAVETAQTGSTEGKSPVGDSRDAQ